ncbi:8-amino-7-oxononanoate synthase [Mucilaginibacter sp. CSA2-8R]|uniref:aminotransferase class I/II-fold pyridoxal phosphate-dependent enzyme n=1 Tax=Mucilaginibacter sp. CSA2-8R TaxID=3141542 RepID=UPI00315D675C
MTHHNFIQLKLQSRQQAGNYRWLKPENSLVDFCSNDYLGFARSGLLAKLIQEEISKYSSINGSTGSRLISGNTEYAESLEQLIADYHKAESGLLFNSGYDANIGLLSSLPQRHDTVIHDELAHASIIDGIRLSNAARFTFKHNDTDSLEQKLKAAKGLIYVIVESVYSMDGDQAPLQAISQLCKQYKAALIVDEAHALGVFGKGLVNQLNLCHEVFARVMTFGKALGAHGAVVLGSTELRSYLVNFARSFIYTTAAPLHQLSVIKMGYAFLANSTSIITELHQKIELYRRSINFSSRVTDSKSAIQTVIIGSNDATKKAAQTLQQQGFDVRPILSPTVAVGSERLRICLHTYNTDEEIIQLTNLIKEYLHAR